MNDSHAHKHVISCIIILCLCFLIQLPCIALEKGLHMSIIQLREVTKSGWHELYKAHERNISVDVDVHVPQVDAFPVLRIKKTSTVSEELLEGLLISINEENILSVTKIPTGYIAPKAESAWFKESFVLQPDEINWDLSLTEDSPLTAQAALDIFRKELSLFFGRERYNELQLKNLWIRGKQYEYDRKTKMFGKPLTELGGYEFTYAQSLYGISVLVDGKYNFSPQIPGELCPPATHISANIVADDLFSMLVQLVDVVDVVQVDVPLLNFESVKTEYEKLINAGMLREVFNIQLGYMLSTDPVEKDVFWASPVWVLNGVMYDNEKQEAPPTNDDIQDTRRIRDVILEGQQGYLIDSNDTRVARRQVPSVISWDQVR